MVRRDNFSFKVNLKSLYKTKTSQIRSLQNRGLTVPYLIVYRIIRFDIIVRKKQISYAIVKIK